MHECLNATFVISCSMWLLPHLCGLACARFRHQDEDLVLLNGRQQPLPAGQAVQ